MTGKSLSRLLMVVMVLALFVAACGTEPEPTVPDSLPAPTQEPVVIVVTATELPQTPTPQVVVVVVTATPGPGSTTPAEEAPATKADTEPAASATPQAAVEAPEPAAVEGDRPAVAMSLAAQKNTTQHSPRPASFVEPASLEDIVPYENWNNIEPNESADFQSYDGVRVVEGGEAILDLGDLMKLILKHDSEMQFVPGSLVQQELDKIAVDIQTSSPLDKLVLAAHLLRGGFLGEKTVGGDPIALTTPNAIVVISGTEFFLAYDPQTETTWVGNFEGTMSVADVELREGDSLPDRQLLAIPAVRERKYWPIHAHMTPAEFSRLIDLGESPIAAADMISGPYLRVIFSPEIAVRSGPGTEFPYVGTLAQGNYERIIGRGRGWWQIECPQNMRAQACWVTGGSAYTENYNLDISPVPVTAARATATAAPTAPRPTVTVPVPAASGDVTNCDYIGNRMFEFDAPGGGRETDFWRSGCPGEPIISFEGCNVVWDARNNNVTSATIGIRMKGYAYSEDIDEYKEYQASLPAGSRSLDLPSYFDGEVTATFNMTLDNGQGDSKRVSRSFDNECG